MDKFKFNNHLKQLPSKQERLKLFGSVSPGPKTKPVNKCDMKDLQNVQKDFLFKLDQVGIDRVKHPVTVISKTHPNEQTTIANFTFTSAIKQTSKGTNMSRFMEQLNNYHKKRFHCRFYDIKNIYKRISFSFKTRRCNHIGRISVVFFERRGPQSNLPGLNHADIEMTTTYHKTNGFSISASLTASITTLCPCSKEISEYSAHNQRGHVTMDVQFMEHYDEGEMDWKLELLEAAESNASARLHPVLKRPDEKNGYRTSI